MDLPLKPNFFLRRFIDLRTPEKKTVHFCHEGGKLMAQGEIKVGLTLASLTSPRENNRINSALCRI